MVSETTALENLKYAHAIDVPLDLSNQDVHELWTEIEHLFVLEKTIAGLVAKLAGHQIANKHPEVGDWVLVKFIPGFQQTYKVVQFMGGQHFGQHKERTIERWWELSSEERER